MKIQRLFLRNVRNIKSLDLDFRDPITGKSMSRVVLAGANMLKNRIGPEVAFHGSVRLASLDKAHTVVSGKMLLSAVHDSLPSPKPTKDQIRNRSLQLAADRIPEDIRLLVEDRILPRWRKARAAFEA